MLLGLGLEIPFAFFFIGVVIVYRLQGGPAMGALPRTTGAPMLVSGEERPTLVPTFTSRPSPAVLFQIGTAEPPTAVGAPAISPPTRLVISKIGIDIPVVSVGSKTVTEQGVRRVIWDCVPDAAGFHQGSAYPGNPGNTVINGHRDIEGAIFRHLDWVTAGDEIVAYAGEVPYHYTVVETMLVPEVSASSEESAESLTLIGYMPEERLTLVTCTPEGPVTEHLMVIAKPTSEGAE